MLAAVTGERRGRADLALARIRGFIAPLLSLATLALVIVTFGVDRLVNALSALTPASIATGLAIVSAKELAGEVGRWHVLLARRGHRVPYAGLLRVYLEVTALKFLLPFKLGDAVRVVSLRARYGVPAGDGAWTRLETMALYLGALLPAIAVVGAVELGLGLGLGIAAAACLSLAVLAVLAGPVLTGAAAFSLGASSVALDVLLYVVLSPVPAGGAELLGVLATLLACTVPVSLRGVGVRELVLSTTAAPLVAAGLAVSVVEVLFVLCAGAATAIVRARASGSARRPFA